MKIVNVKLSGKDTTKVIKDLYERSTHISVNDGDSCSIEELNPIKDKQHILVLTDATVIDSSSVGDITFNDTLDTIYLRELRIEFCCVVPTNKHSPRNTHTVSLTTNS